MVRLRKRRVFLFLVVVFFAIGHTHQVFGRLHAHHHGAEAVEHYHHDDADHHHPSDEDQQKDADHMAEHTAVVAVVPSVIMPQLGELHLIGSVDSAVTKTAEPRPVAIDHPPQLIG